MGLRSLLLQLEEPSLGGGQGRGKNSPGLVRAGRQVGSGSVCMWRGWEVWVFGLKVMEGWEARGIWREKSSWVSPEPGAGSLVLCPFSDGDGAKGRAS